MPKKKKAAKKKTASKKKAAKKTAAKKKKPAAKSAVKKKKTAKKSAGKKKAARNASSAKKKKSSTSKTAKTKMNKVTKISKKSGGKAKKTSAKDNFTPYKFKRGEEYMGPDQVAHFRDILLKWKRELMEEVDRTVHHMRDEASNFPDPNDRATQEEEFALELRTRDRERKLIKKIDESLMDLDNGEYGYCEICGVEIGVRRLEARPTATLCIDCKTLDEIKERHLG